MATVAQGVVIMIALAVILAAILLALLMPSIHLCDPFPPSIIQVAAVHDYNEAGTVLNYDSRLLLRNMGTRAIPNGPLTAAFYADDRRVPCVLVTFHGEDFIPSHHFGIEWIQGQGCRGDEWEVGASVLIDFTDRTFMPAQTIRVDVIDTAEGCIISSCRYRRSGVPAR